MRSPEESIETRCLAANKSLVAADIDQTLLYSGAERERQHFLDNLAPELLRSASMGVNLAFLTANSMHELSSRFLRWLLDQLAHTDHLSLLDHFHFFVNSAGVYVNFAFSDKRLELLLGDRSSRAKADKVFKALTTLDGRQHLAIQPRFINTDYVERCRISDEDSAAIVGILDRAAQGYVREVEENRSLYGSMYDLSMVSDDSGLRVPRVDLRTFRYGEAHSSRTTSVQHTLKPILSFRHAYDPRQAYRKDPRSRVIERIQEDLDTSGLGHYVARPGGLSSIDVALEKVDKAYALEFLIDRLNLRGCTRRGQRIGSNAIYIGDEVIVGDGNDYPITRIPGLLVFAVNPDQQLIPFLSHVFVPSAILVGPDATAHVLGRFNQCVLRLLKEAPTEHPGGTSKTALELFKEELFVERIRDTLSHMGNSGVASVEDWQTIHTLVSLMRRNDPAARQWLAILIQELDEVMTQLAADKSCGAGAAAPHLPE